MHKPTRQFAAHHTTYIAHRFLALPRHDVGRGASHSFTSLALVAQKSSVLPQAFATRSACISLSFSLIVQVHFLYGLMMNTATSPYLTATNATIPNTARYALQLLEKLQHGVLTVHFPDGSSQYFGDYHVQTTSGTHAHFSASITLHNWNVCEVSRPTSWRGSAKTRFAMFVA